MEVSIPSAPLENISGTYVFEVGSFQCVPPPGRTTLQDRSRGAGLAPRPKPRSRPRFLCHDLTGAIGQIISAKTYVNLFEGPVTGNIPEVLDNGEATDGTHVTAGQPRSDALHASDRPGGEHGSLRQQDNRVTAELASKLDSSALAPIAPLTTAAALATTDGQVAAHASSIAALPDHVSLQQGRPVGLRRAGGRGGHEEHPGRCGPHDGHERLHRLGQQRHAGHGGGQLRPQDGGGPALPRHSGEDHAAGGRHQGGQRSPENRHRRSAGLQARKSRRLRGLLGRSHRRRPSARRWTGKIANALLGLATEACTPRTPCSQPARPRSRAPSTQSLRSLPPCSFPAAELLTRRPGRASQLGSSFAEATSFATCIWRLLSLLRWPTATTR